jgi:hypothetical protein
LKEYRRLNFPADVSLPHVEISTWKHKKFFLKGNMISPEANNCIMTDSNNNKVDETTNKEFKRIIIRISMNSKEM